MSRPALVRGAAGMLGAAAFAALVGCASVQEAAPVGAKTPTAKPQPRTSGAPRFNLVGYSDAYKTGHAHACAQPSRRDAARLENDADYAMGWNDGRFACGKR